MEMISPAPRRRRSAKRARSTRRRIRQRYMKPIRTHDSAMSVVVGLSPRYALRFIAEDRKACARVMPPSIYARADVAAKKMPDVGDIGYATSALREAAAI